MTHIILCDESVEHSVVESPLYDFCSYWSQGVHDEAFLVMCTVGYPLESVAPVSEQYSRDTTASVDNMQLFEIFNLDFGNQFTCVHHYHIL